MTEDLIIRGGTVIDGTGRSGFAADVAIRDGRIQAVGDDITAGGARVIEAAGHVVAPGFIDIKTHSDWTLPLMPQSESKVHQGVTTEVIGHCGYSCAPALPGRAEALAQYLSPSAPWLDFKETTFAAYAASYPETSVNRVMLVGHNTLRLMAMGMEDRPPEPDELALMAELLAEALDAGALGLSSGLFTAPGCYADGEELVALGRILKARGGRYFTHLRDEANTVFDALEEAIEFAQQTGVHVQIVHVKLSGMDNWGGAARLIERLDAARREGAAIDCDQYPYTAASNPLRNLFPSWLQDGGIDAMLGRLSSPDVRARLRADIAKDGLNNFGRIPSWDAIRISISPDQPYHAGKTVAEIATERGVDPFDAALDYIVADRGQTRVLVTSISEDDVKALIASAQGHGGLGRQRGRSLRHHRAGQAAPALLRHVRAYPRPLRARPRIAADRDRDPQDDRRLGGRPGARRARRVAGGRGRRRDDLRSRHDRRAGELPGPPPIRHRRVPRVGQRHRRARPRRAYQRAPGPHAAARPKPVVNQIKKGTSPWLTSLSSITMAHRCARPRCGSIWRKKAFPWEGHYIDILAGEQFNPEYVKLNPKAVVPTLVHNGTVVRESTNICEYLDDVFSANQIRPSDPMTRAEVRYWTKAVDEELHPACGALTFMASHRHTIMRLGPEGVQKFLDSTPPFSVTAGWHEQKLAYVRDGFDAPGAREKIGLYDRYLQKMEETLQKTKWLAGDDFTFADIAMTPYVVRLDMLSMNGVWDKGRLPKVERWLGDIKARPTFKPAFLDWMPQQLTRDLKNNGAQSWPEVAKMLNIAA